MRWTLALVSCVSVFSQFSLAQSCGDPSKAVPFYRSLGGNDHFYTTSAQEQTNAAPGYSPEIIAALVFTHKESQTVPFYRLYNGGNHFYTTDSVERTRVLGGGVYIDEGVAAYIYPADAKCSGTVPLYRLYGAASGDHLYTVDADERDRAVKGSGYTYEWIAGYVLPPKETVPKPSVEVSHTSSVQPIVTPTQITLTLSSVAATTTSIISSPASSSSISSSVEGSAKSGSSSTPTQSTTVIPPLEPLNAPASGAVDMNTAGRLVWGVVVTMTALLW